MSEAEYDSHGVELAVSQRRHNHIRARALSARRSVILGLCLPLANLAERTCSTFSRLNLHCHCNCDPIQSSGVSRCIIGSTVISGGNRRFIYRGTGTQFSTFHLNFGVERHFTCVLQGGLRQLNSCRLRQRPHNGQFFSTCLNSGGFFSAIPD